MAGQGWFLQRGWTFWQTTASMRGFFVGALAGFVLGEYVLVYGLRAPFFALGYAAGLDRLPDWAIDRSPESVAATRARLHLRAPYAPRGD